MNNLIALLNSIHPMSEALRQHLSAILRTREVEKKEFLLRAGQTSKNIFFIDSGLLRCFYSKDNGDVSSWFMKEGDVIVSVESWFLQQPSYEYIQALEDSLVHYISWEQLQLIYREFPEFNFIGRVLTEKYYTLSERRLYSIRMHRASERYHYFVRDHADLINRIPVKYLASYLDISRETLSRIRHDESGAHRVPFKKFKPE